MIAGADVATRAGEQTTRAGEQTMSMQYVKRLGVSAPAAAAEPLQMRGGKTQLKAMSYEQGAAALAPKDAKGGGEKAGLKRGDRGPEVVALQTALKRMSLEAQVDAEFKAMFDPGVIDGVYGGGVAEAVKAIQSNNNLDMTGVYDAETAQALADDLSYLDMMQASMRGE